MSEEHQYFNSIFYINHYLELRYDFVDPNENTHFMAIHDLFRENIESYKKCYIIADKFINILNSDINDNKSHPLYDQLFIYKLFKKDFLNFLNNYS